MPTRQDRRAGSDGRGARDRRDAPRRERKSRDVSHSRHASHSPRPSRRRLARRSVKAHLEARCAELEEAVARQTTEMGQLVKQLQRTRPKRPKMSSVRSVWIAGRQGFLCATPDRSTCPCWLLERPGLPRGVLPQEGWQIDHICPWAKSYNDDMQNLRALCSYCHFRITKQSMMDDEDSL